MSALPSTIRLKPALAVFRTGDGTVYLLRDWMVAEFAVDEPGERELALLSLLEEPRSMDQLVEGLGRRGFPTPAAEIEELVRPLAELGLLEDPADVSPSGLDPEDLLRYDRQLAYFADVRPGHAASMQRSLASATVTIVGVGGLGTWSATGLACAGVGHLVLVDDDTVELSNLNRQVLYRRSDVGRPKVEVAAEALAAFNPGLRLTAHRERVDSAAVAASVVEGADFVVETGDWPPYELSRWLDAACWERGVPRIQAAQFPPRVRIGPTFVPGSTGCFECLERAVRQEYPLYDEIAAFRRSRHPVAATLGPLCGVIGSSIAMDVVHHITGIAPPATAGAAVTVDLRDWSVTREAVEVDPDCPRCGGTNSSLTG
jgi:bacteriocin biosynthesis cyclodehydratase domain-containing protein